MRSIALLLSWLLCHVLAGAAFAAEPSPPAQKAFAAAIEDAKTTMMANPQAALPKTRVAFERAQALQGREGAVARATALWLEAEANLGLNRLDRAGEVLALALPLAEAHARNTKLHGDLIRSRGSLAGLRGKAEIALGDFLRAHRIFRDAGETRSQAIALQDIGQIYWEAGDHERMLSYLAQANELYDADPSFSLATHNNKGEALRALGRGAEAEKAYRAALEDARTLESAMLQTRILTNLALVQTDLGKLGEAQASAMRALKIGASPDAADWRPFVMGALARIAAARGDYEQAATLLAQTFAGAKLDKTDLVYKEYHELGSTVYERIGRAPLALAHLKAFTRLDTEARSLTANTSSQLLAARFDYTNQNLRITQLKQGQLERDVRIERQRVQFRTTLFAAVAIAGSVLIGFMAYSYVSIRRSRNRIRANNVELNEVNGKLETALRAKTDFLAMTSHEIRTPLNGILGMTQVMLAGSDLDSRSRERVQLVHGAGETMKSLVDDILDVAKMETGATEVSLAPVNVEVLLAEAIGLWRTNAEAKGLAFLTQIDTFPHLATTDSKRVRQIVFNLLSNAVKFTDVGNVSLSVRRLVDQGTVEIEVVDTGIGIPESQLSVIFEAFRQVDSDLSRKHGGTGLGLAICRNLVEALDGTILVESEPGCGTRFVVMLPLVEGDLVANRKTSQTHQPRIGFVEADEKKRVVFTTLLRPHASALHLFDTLESVSGGVAAAALGILMIDATSVADDTDRQLILASVIEEADAAGTATVILVPGDCQALIDAVRKMSPARLVLKPVKGSALVAELAATTARTCETPFALVA